MGLRCANYAADVARGLNSLCFSSMGPWLGCAGLVIYIYTTVEIGITPFIDLSAIFNVFGCLVLVSNFTGFWPFYSFCYTYRAIGDVDAMSDEASPFERTK